MKITNYFKDFKFFPIIRETVKIPTTQKVFLDKLKKVTEKDFDLVGSFNTSGEKHTHEYQSEINGTNFKLRRIQASGYKISPFIGTIVYGKIIEKEDGLTFKYFMIFNIFTNLLFLCIMLGGIYASYLL